MGDINKKMVTGWYGGCTNSVDGCEDLNLSEGLGDLRYNIDMIYKITDRGHAWSVPWKSGTQQEESDTDKYPRGSIDYDSEHNPLFDRLECGSAYVIVSSTIPYELPGFFVSHDLKQEESARALHTSACCNTDSLVVDADEVPGSNQKWIDTSINPPPKDSGAGDLGIGELEELFGGDGGVGDHNRTTNGGLGHGSIQLDFWNHDGESVASVGSGPMSCIDSDTWVHITVVRNENVVSMYVNGVISGTTTIAPQFNNKKDVDVLLGAVQSSNWKLDNGFNGQITNVGMWDRTLSSKEVGVVYNNGERLTGENWSDTLQPPEANLMSSLLYFNTFGGDTEEEADWTGFGIEDSVTNESLVTSTDWEGNRFTFVTLNSGDGYIRRINHQDNTYLSNYYTNFPFDENTSRWEGRAKVKRFALKLEPSSELKSTFLSSNAGSQWSFSLWAKKSGSAISSFSFNKISKDAMFWSRIGIDYNNASSVMGQYAPLTAKRNFVLFWQGEPGELPSNSIEPCPIKATTPGDGDIDDGDGDIDDGDGDGDIDDGDGDGDIDDGDQSEQPQTMPTITIERVKASIRDMTKKDVLVEVDTLGSYDYWIFQIDGGPELRADKLNRVSQAEKFTSSDIPELIVIYDLDILPGTHRLTAWLIKVYDEEHLKIATDTTTFNVPEPEETNIGGCPSNFAYGITHPKSIRIYDDIKFSWQLGNETNSESLAIYHRLKRADGSWDSDVFTWTGHNSLRSDPRWKTLAPWTPPFTSFTYKPTPTLDGEGTGSHAVNEYGNIRPGDKVVFHFTCSDGYGSGEYIDVSDRSFYSTEIEVTDISLPLQIHEVSMSGYNFNTGEVTGGGEISHGSPVVVLWKTMSPNGGFELTGDYYRPTIVKVWRQFWAAYLGPKRVPLSTPGATQGWSSETLIETTVDGGRFDIESKDDAYNSIEVGDTIWASVRSTTNSGNSNFVALPANKGLQVVSR